MSHANVVCHHNKYAKTHQTKSVPRHTTSIPARCISTPCVRVAGCLGQSRKIQLVQQDQEPLLIGHVPHKAERCSTCEWAVCSKL